MVSVRHYDYFGFTSIGVSRRNLDQSEVLAVLPVYHEIGISAGVKYHTQHLEQEGDDSTSSIRDSRIPSGRSYAQYTLETIGEAG